MNSYLKKTGFALVWVIASMAIENSSQSQALVGKDRKDTMSHGSVGVAVMRADTIVVATESRTSTDGVVNPDTACKMTIVHGIVFAAAGLLKGNDATPGIVDYARSILAGPGKIESKTDMFQAGASRMLTSWLNDTDDRESLASSPDFRNRHSLHAVFCFFSKGRPVVVKYDFVPSLAAGRFKIGGAYDAGVRKPGEIVWIGEFEQTDSLMTKDSSFAKEIGRREAASAAIALVRRQMQFTPTLVGGPIDIAIVTRTGARWIQRKQNCE